MSWLGSRLCSPLFALLFPLRSPFIPLPLFPRSGTTNQSFDRCRGRARQNEGGGACLTLTPGLHSRSHLLLAPWFASFTLLPLVGSRRSPSLLPLTPWLASFALPPLTGSLAHVVRPRSSRWLLGSRRSPSLLSLARVVHPRSSRWLPGSRRSPSLLLLAPWLASFALTPLAGSLVHVIRPPSRLSLAPPFAFALRAPSRLHAMALPLSLP